MGLLIGGVSGYLIGHASPSTSSSRKQTSWSGNQSGSSSNIDLEQLTAEDVEANFSWEQSDIEQLQFLTERMMGRLLRKWSTLMERLVLFNLIVEN